MELVTFARSRDNHMQVCSNLAKIYLLFYSEIKIISKSHWPSMDLVSAAVYECLVRLAKRSKDDNLSGITL